MNKYPQNNKPLTVLNASAGSGKTYNLALYFLSYLLKESEGEKKSPLYFRHILAITFTNKATREIRERIIKFLRLLAHPRTSKEKKEAQEIKEHLKRLIFQIQGNDNDPELPAKIYHKLLHHLDELHISTIDSFINRLGKAAAFDLMLPTGYEVTTAAHESLDQVIDYLMLQIRDIEDETQPEARQWMSIVEELKEFIREQALAGDMSWSKLLQGEKLKEAGKELFDSHTLDMVEESRRQLMEGLPEPTLSALFQRLKEQRNEAQQKLKETIKKYHKHFQDKQNEIEELIQSEGIDPAEDLAARASKNSCNASKGFKTLKEFSHSLNLLNQKTDTIPWHEVEKELDDLMKFPSLAEYFDLDKEWTKAKKSTLSQQTKQKIARLTKEIEQLHATTQAQLLFQLSVIHTTQKLFIYFLMHRLLETTLSKNSKLYLGWLSLKLSRYLTTNPECPPQIYEQLGSFYKHFLIDEFQDTSVTQWRILYPFLAESTSQGLESLIVGDPKQSIYEWRGGESQLLVTLAQAGETTADATAPQKLEELSRQMLHYLGFEEKHLPEVRAFMQRIKTEVLGKNFRSARRIVEFNNEVFHQTIGEKDKTHSKTGTGNPFIAAVYGTKGQAPHQSNEAGLVAFCWLSGSKKYLETAQKVIRKHIREWAGGEDNYKGVAILCRKNDEVNAIVQALTSHTEENTQETASPVPAYAPGSLTIDHAHAVNFLVAFLKSLAQPSNRLAKAEARFFYYLYRRALNQEDGQQQPSERIEHKTLQEMFSEVPEGFDWDYYRNMYQIDIAFEQLNGKNIYDIVLEVIDGFGLLELPNEQAYVFRFLEEVHQFVHTEGQQLHAFVKYWDKLSEVPALQDRRSNAVQVMTIHKSKGLEFPVSILLPNWQLIDAKRKHTIRLKTKNSPLPYLLLTLSTNKFNTLKNYEAQLQTECPENEWLKAVNKAYDTLIQRELLAQLNILYVASTRPQHRAYFMLPLQGKQDSNNKIERIHDFLPELSATHQDSGEVHTTEGIISYTIAYVKGNPEEPLPKEEVGKATQDIKTFEFKPEV
ncbi:ATP-dependent exoDNAse (exonuclease V) beta subunit [Thermonema lapsum]|uniref:DNA 3'-5' helicase n=1 Tax=Thermonema lapsum TaxID=28195 RepID=A0A846MQA2_9BACT|nr:UvrD-helicase domain-containing protein [Thermonema lapsum]NIK73635.1 ATP-dependent exoDNAse (exonuclease V) beta subunit [Thermonema lapsum]